MWIFFHFQQKLEDMFGCWLYLWGKDPLFQQIYLNKTTVIVLYSVWKCPESALTVSLSYACTAAYTHYELEKWGTWFHVIVKMFHATSASSFISSLNLWHFKNLFFSPTVHSCLCVCVCACVCIYVCVHACLCVCVCFINCEGQSHKTESTNHNVWRERRAEVESNQVLLLTSLMPNC